MTSLFRAILDHCRSVMEERDPETLVPDREFGLDEHRGRVRVQPFDHVIDRRKQRVEIDFADALEIRDGGNEG